MGDLNYVYNQASIEDKQTYLKTIFPAGLITTEGGYRTALLPKLFIPNALSLGTFLELKTERELAFSDKLPVGVGNGNEIEPLLQIIERIIKER